MQSASKLWLCCYCIEIGQSFSNFSTKNTSECESFSPYSSGGRTTLVVIVDLDIGQEDNRSTSSEKKEKTSHLTSVIMETQF